MDTIKQRAFSNMRGMLAAFSKSEYHRKPLMAALANFGFKSADEVDEARLFDVCECAREQAGFAAMTASAKAGLGTTAAKTTADRLQALAMNHYANADAKNAVAKSDAKGVAAATPLAGENFFEGSAATIDPAQIYAKFNKPGVRSA